jgi:pyruvate ferredoxin oxidoreductase alpha subunit
MLVRDSGAIQLFAENAQEAYDLMVLAPRLAEHPAVQLPVLVCQDGFTITHSSEPVTLLPDGAVREFVGEYRLPAPLLDLARPTSQGPFAMPDAYFELRYQQAAALVAALDAFDEVAEEFAALSGRRYHALEPYALDGAERVAVTLGSSGGTVKDAVDAMRADGHAVGSVEIRAFRPFPHALARLALGARRSVAILDRADSPGGRPPLYAEVAAALTGTHTRLDSYVFGLGGRDLHPEDVREVLVDEREPGAPPVYVGLRGAPCPA